MSEKAKTVEIVEPEIVKVEEKKLPSKNELREQGWSEKELESAQKLGMVKEKKEEKDEKVEANDAETKIDAKEESKAETKKEELVAERPKSSVPDFTFKTPEQEKVFLDAFGEGTPQRAMYFRMKSERRDRQRAQDENNKTKLENQILKDQLDEFKRGKVEAKVDENGDAIDPDNQPLTPKMLREIREKEEQERQEKENEIRSHGAKVAEALQEQEEFAKQMNPDYEHTVELAKEVKTRLDELIVDVKTQRRILKLFRDLEVASANADKLTPEDYNAADIAYEIGKFHPNYGKSVNGHSTDDGKSQTPNKANGSLTPEQMKRIETNTQRRTSSASIPGAGGRRVISVEDVTAADVLKMTREQRDKFRREHPEKMAQLLRG